MIPRYSVPEISKIWSDENKFRRWLDVELAVCQAWTEKGVIPREDFENIKAKASFDVDRIHEIEEVTRHDMIAFNTCVAETVGESGRYIHLGLTSSDVIDTASSLQLAESIEITVNNLIKLQTVVGRQAITHKFTPCAGRTHGVHAELTTFGLKLLNHYAEIKRDIERLKTAQNNIRVGAISGAVGTYANCPPEIEARACELLGLKPDAVSTQIIQRDRHAEVLTAIAIAGATLERLALEIRHLQRTELLEALEPFRKGQKGSSAMPHKKNPILCERVCGMARLLRGNVVPALENIALWHERDISHSSVERTIWPDSFQLINYICSILIKIFEKLVVNTNKMRENIDITQGLLFSGRVLLALVEEEGLSREEAYAIVQDNAMLCWETKTPLLQLLVNDLRIKKLTGEDLCSLFDMDYYFKHIDEIFARFPELDNAGK